MPRQRLRSGASPLSLLGRLLTALLALALVWYGLMTLLLAVKVAPSTVNALSGYRSAFDWLAGLAPGDVDGGTTRPIIAGAGVVAFLLFGYLALKQLPRPHLARHPLVLATDERGEITLQPRAIERMAEAAAGGAAGVSRASGRYGTDDLSVNVTLTGYDSRSRRDLR